MSEELLQKLEEIDVGARKQLVQADSIEDVERLRVDYLGRKDGKLSRILHQLGGLDPDARAAVGGRANVLKAGLTALLDEKRKELESAAAGKAAGPDLTLPGRHVWKGALHPVTQVVEEICEVFRSLGFTRVRGPEADTDWYNFTALNTPLDHPAADAHDTFYLGEGLLLRSHTSPAQIRTMQQFQPPIRVVVPGMAYRRDPFDASHAPGFEQLEGLVVDEGITFVDFKATLAEFARRMFGARARTRLRPSYFPFTEPSAEMDVSCILCGGTGCSACKGTGWMEIMGCGMVDPAVFEHVGYDPERYTGFAFGMGPGRIAMLRYGITDIRTLYEADVRFLEQFA